MTALFTSVAGMAPQGADVLREHVRWSDAERRWRVFPVPSRTAPQPPLVSPPVRAALHGGAWLSSATDACGTRAITVRGAPS